MSSLTQIIADAYRQMVNPSTPTSVARPKWVPASITEDSVTSFVQAVTEARKANQSVVEFNGKKYGINSIKEDASEEDQGKAKKLQDMDAEKAPKQPSDEVPTEVKEEDSEEIKADNHDEKAADADEMPKLDDEKVEEELSDEEDADHAEPDADDMGGPSDHDADNEDEDEKEEDEKPKLTGEQVMASLAATYASMVNENVAGDPHAANLSAKANSATALAHSSNSNTHHEDAQHAHNLAAEHYRVYAHHAGDPQIRSAANIHHEFHRSMSNHHMLNLVSFDTDKEAHDMAGKKSVEEGTAADAEAGPEVMDPATQKMKDDADDETEVVDMLPTAAQDGGDKLDAAKKPAPANSSAALPKVAIVDAPAKLGESALNENEGAAGETLSHSQALSQAAHAASKLADHHNTPEWHKHAAALHDLAMGYVGTREGEKAHMDMHTHHFPKAQARPFDATLRNKA
jgi:hypothetical protein